MRPSGSTFAGVRNGFAPYIAEANKIDNIHVAMCLRCIRPQFNNGSTYDARRNSQHKDSMRVYDGSVALELPIYCRGARRWSHWEMMSSADRADSESASE